MEAQDLQIQEKESTLQEAAKRFYEDIDREHYKYDAFISYRHLEPDATIAKAIHTMLENYKPPIEFKRNGQLPRFRVFRDREELATASLNESLDQALRSSHYLVVICSKRLPLSEWCNTEVETFLKLRGPEYIIPVLIEGETEDSFPYVLRDIRQEVLDADGHTVQMNFEHLAADLRPKEVQSPDFVGYETLEKTNPDKVKGLTKEAVKLLKTSEQYRIISGMFACNLGDLKNRAKERQQRLLLTIGGLITLALAIFGLFMWNAYQKEEVAKRQSQQSRAQVLLNLADETLKDGDRVKAALIADYAMKGIDKRANLYQDLKTQQEAVYSDALYNPSISVKTTIHNDNNLAFPELNHAETLIASGLGSDQVGVWRVNSGELVAAYHGHTGLVKNTSFSHDDKLLLSAGMDNRLNVWQEGKEKPVMQRDFPNNIISAVFSHDDKAIYTVHYEGQEAVFTTTAVATGTDMFSPLRISMDFNRISYHPNAYQVLVTSKSEIPEKSMALYDLKTQKIIKNFEPLTNQAINKKGAFEDGRFSPSGKAIIAIVDSHYHLINTQSGKVTTTFNSQVFRSGTTSISPILDEKHDFFYLPNINLIVYEGKNGRKLDEINFGHVTAALSINRSGDVLSISKTGDLTLLKNHQILTKNAPSSIASPESIYLTQNGQYGIVTSRSYKTISIIDLKPSKNTLSIAGFIVGTSQNGQYSLLSDQGHFILRDNDKEKNLQQLNFDSILTNNTDYWGDLIKVDNSGRYLAIPTLNRTSSIKTVQIYDLQDKKMVNHLPYTGAVSELDIEFMEDSQTSVFINDGKGSHIYPIQNSDKAIYQRDVAQQSGIPISIIPLGDHIVAYNFLEGNAEIYDFKSEKVLQTFTGRIVYLEEKDGKVLARGITSKQAFTWTEGEKTQFHPIDAEWSEISTFGKDIHHYNPKTDILVTMRNQANANNEFQAYVVDFSSGKIIKRLISRSSLRSNIYISPNGKNVYFNSNLVAASEKEDTASTSSQISDSSSSSTILIYRLSDKDELAKDIKDYIGGRQLTKEELATID